MLSILFVGSIMLLLAFQGFDVCDEGWYMTSYQQIFNAPETVEYNFVFWFTTLIGGLWYELFPSGGILSFRTLTIIVYLLTFLLAYKIAIQFVRKELVLLGLLLATFVNNFGFLAFYYNHMTGLTSVLMVYFFMKGFQKKTLIHFLLAGLCLSFSTFSRLPNIVFIASIVVFPLQQILDKERPFKLWLKQLLIYFLGTFLGFTLIYLIQSAFGHTDIMKQAFLGLFDKGQNVDSNHNIAVLLKVYLSNYTKVFLYSVPVLLTTALGMYIFSFVRNKLLRILFLFGCLILFTMFFRKETVYILYGLGIFAFIYIFFKKTVSVNFKLYSVLAVLVMFCTPLGSDGGIKNAGYCGLWLIMPLFFYTVSDLKNIHYKKQKLYKNITATDVKLFILVLMIAFFAVKLRRFSIFAYFDMGSRLEKTYAINNDLSKYIYTTRQRADIINPILEELSKHVKPNDYLLVYDNAPMLNFLTQTKPYMGISWVWVYDSQTFDRKIKKAEKEITEMPIVVQQKFHTIGAFSEPLDDYMSETKKDNYLYKGKRVKAMNDFLQRNAYEIIWSNAHFNIYKSNKP